MKKTEFIELLRKKLSIIEENELNDILDEYEQHIIMKTEGGNFTEEEAIEDFGDLNQLTAEILEAYHVRTNYDENDNKENKIQITEKSKEYAGKISIFFSKTTKKISNSFKKCCASINNFFRKIFKKDVYYKNSNAEQKVSIPIKNNSDTKNNFIHNVLSICGKFVCNIVILLKWCLSILIKIFILCIGLIAALFSAADLILLCMLIVLLLSGYPLLGISIISTGFLICSCIFTLLIFSLLKDKNELEGGNINE